MKCRRGLLLVILLYVTLDLSVPAIPGAFVFESADSVEISRSRAGEGKAEPSVLPALVSASLVVSQPLVDLRDHPTTPGSVAVLGHPVLSRLPRATLDPSPPSEDPH